MRDANVVFGDERRSDRRRTAAHVRFTRVRAAQLRPSDPAPSLLRADVDRNRSQFSLEHGSLYPALHRLEDRAWISSFWGTSENNRRARYYRLTASGRRALGAELESWRRFAAGLETVLRTS